MLLTFYVICDIIELWKGGKLKVKISGRGSEEMKPMPTIAEIAVAEAKKSERAEILSMIYKMKLDGKTDKEIVAFLITMLSK